MPCVEDLDFRMLSGRKSAFSEGEMEMGNGFSGSAGFAVKRDKCIYDEVICYKPLYSLRAGKKI